MGSVFYSPVHSYIYTIKGLKRRTVLRVVVLNIFSDNSDTISIEAHSFVSSKNTRRLSITM